MFAVATTLGIWPKPAELPDERIEPMNEFESYMQVTVNGQGMDVPNGVTIAQLLEQLEITHPAVAVELNFQIQPRTVFEEQVLCDKDCLEIVSLVGGG